MAYQLPDSVTKMLKFLEKNIDEKHCFDVEKAREYVKRYRDMELEGLKRSA